MPKFGSGNDDGTSTGSGASKPLTSTSQWERIKATARKLAEAGIASEPRRPKDPGDDPQYLAKVRARAVERRASQGQQHVSLDVESL